MTWIVLSSLVLSAALKATAWPADQRYDAKTIIERSVLANASDWKAAPDYACFERDQQPGGGTRTYENLMIAGSPYQRLSAIDGKPLSLEQQVDEQRKLEAVIYDRRVESAWERAERIAKYQKDRQRDQMLMNQLTKALDFTLIGDQKMNGREVYVLKATPKVDYKPPSMETEVLKGMQGKLWIDKQTFQWVKVEAQVIRPVSIEGFLAEVEPGTRFELEKIPVEDGIWLPGHFAMRSKAKVFFLFNRKSQADETYYGYHKATADSSAGR